MRFPFTFMGLLSVAFGAWVILYVTALHRTADTFTEAIEVLGGAISLALGAYLLARRVRRGREA